MSEMNHELEQYRNFMDRLHAPEALYTEVWNMTINAEDYSQRPIRRVNHRVLAMAAVIALLLAMGIATYAAKPGLFGWGGNFEVRDIGNGTHAILHTESLVDPVEVEDGRLWFIVNDEHIDITDETSETEPFLYDYTDEDGIIHHWIVGKNGPEPENWGYSEYLEQPGKDWIVGYTARTNLDPDSEGPAWLTAGKAILGVPW